MSAVQILTDALTEVRKELSRSVTVPFMGDTHVAEAYGLEDLLQIVEDALWEVGHD